METLLYLSILLPLFFVLLLHKTLRAQRKIKAGYNLPPGPPKLPIIGNMHNLRGEHPHRRLAALAQTYGPIFHLKLGEINVIVVTSPALAAEVTRTHDLNFASRPQFMGTKVILYDGGDLVFAPYGKLWAQLRKICTVSRAFYPKNKPLAFAQHLNRFPMKDRSTYFSSLGVLEYERSMKECTERVTDYITIKFDGNMKFDVLFLHNSSLD